MSEIQVSMSKLRQNLGSLVNRAAYGGEHIVLVAHGEPKAAIIGIEDLRRLQQLNDYFITHKEQESTVLARADRLREQIRAWQEAHGITPEATAETLDQLRAERDDELLRLR